MLVRRCGELCVSHVRSPDYSRCKATEEQASPVAGNGYLTVGAGSNRSRRSIAALRSTTPLCFFRRFERLKRLERFEPSVSAPRFTVCDAFPRTVNHLG